MTSAAIYCRISRDQLDQRLGVKRQEKDCRSLAQRNGWKVGLVLVDNDTSASNGKPRPGYEQLLQAIEANEVDAVIVWDLDRLVRRPVELEHFFSVADATGMAKLATIGDNIEYGIRVMMDLPRVRRSNTATSALLISTASFSPSASSRPRAETVTSPIRFTKR